MAIDPFRFVFMADCQLGCYASFSGLSEQDVAEYASKDLAVRAAPVTTGFAWDAERYGEAIALANRLDPDFVVMGGDMVDDPFDEQQYAELRRVTAELRAPMYWVAGNHDIGEDTDVPTPRSMAHYRERYGSDHHAFVHKGATFIVVDTVVWAHADRVPDEWDAQLAFLRKALEEGRARGGPIVVFGHHPLFIRTPDEPDDYFNIPRPRRAMLLELLADHGVSTFLCGHWHRNAVRTYRGVEIAVTGAVGYPLGVDPSGLRLVEVTDAGVTHTYLPTDPALTPDLTSIRPRPVS